MENQEATIASLKYWSQFLFWISIILPMLAAVATGVRYYLERYERRLTGELTANAIKQAQDEAVVARSEIAETREKQKAAEAAYALLKRTPPKINPYLATSTRTGDLLLVIDAENLVPFRTRWVIVTENNRIITGVMLEDQEIHPQKDEKRFTAKADINAQQVTNEYIELRFRYESIYSAELGNPADLRGEIIRKYRYKDNKVWPQE